jgi:AcrR family transcriptional regulator
MVLDHELNRQALRSKAMIQEALIELLKEKPYHKITITEISKKSGLTRSTFYAHFETKDDLLKSVINELLDEFFELLYARKGMNDDAQRDLDINIRFFKIWQSHPDVIKILNSVDFDCLLVERMKAYWQKHAEEVLIRMDPNRSPHMTRYLNSFLAYSFVGILKQWLAEGMQPPPEILGQLLYQLTGPPVLVEAREKLQNLFN